jgi:hypothetical protein
MSCKTPHTLFTVVKHSIAFIEHSDRTECQGIRSFVLEQGPSSSINTMDNQVGRVIRRGDCIDHRVMLPSHYQGECYCLLGSAYHNRISCDPTLDCT